MMPPSASAILFTLRAYQSWRPWQAGEALAHAVFGSDWPPACARDDDDPAHIIVDQAEWPITSR